jgi:hypothetical protein
MKPLLRGRLLDNFKILNDIQEQHHADRIDKTVCCERATIEQELKDGKRWMRFATAGEYSSTCSAYHGMCIWQI